MNTLLSAFLYVLCLSSAQAASSSLTAALSDVGPFAYKEDRKLKGINYDILEQLAKESKLTFKYKLYPHIRMVTALESISPDITILFEKSCLKFEDYEVQAELYTAKPLLFTNRIAPVKESALRIGFIRGTCLDIRKRLLDGKKTVDILDMTQALSMFKAGRIDGICGLAPVVKFALTQSKSDLKLNPLHTESEILKAVLCRRKDLPDETKKSLDAALKKVSIPKIE